jgi:hypothetical protein
MSYEFARSFSIPLAPVSDEYASFAETEDASEAKMGCRRIPVRERSCLTSTRRRSRSLGVGHGGRLTCAVTGPDVAGIRSYVSQLGHRSPASSSR